MIAYMGQTWVPSAEQQEAMEAARAYIEQKRQEALLTAETAPVEVVEPPAAPLPALVAPTPVFAPPTVIAEPPMEPLPPLEVPAVVVPPEMRPKRDWMPVAVGAVLFAALQVVTG